MLESLIALPVLLLAGLSVVQWAFVYEARAFVDHGALMAARAGALDNARMQPMRLALARALTPLQPSARNVGAFETRVISKTLPDILLHARLRILNPTREAFADHGQRNRSGERYLPFRDIHQRPSKIGQSSQLSLQDATLLRVQVSYGYPLRVPYAGWFIAKAALGASWLGSEWDIREQIMLRSNRLPIVATATVRVQSRIIDGGQFPNKDDISETARTKPARKRAS